MLLNSTQAIIWLCVFAAVFAVPGLYYARRQQDNIEDFVVARNSQSGMATMLTLLATTLGTWMLFGPAEAATWGGIGAITGQSCGIYPFPQHVLFPNTATFTNLSPHEICQSQERENAESNPLNAIGQVRTARELGKRDRIRNTRLIRIQLQETAH